MKICLTALIVLSAATAALADERDDIHAACETQTWLKAGVCNCMADKAMRDLNEKQRAWLVASVKQDQTQAMQLQGDMTINELTAVGAFMAQNMLGCEP